MKSTSLMFLHRLRSAISHGSSRGKMRGLKVEEGSPEPSPIPTPSVGFQVASVKLQSGFSRSSIELIQDNKPCCDKWQMMIADSARQKRGQESEAPTRLLSQRSVSGNLLIAQPGFSALLQLYHALRFLLE